MFFELYDWGQLFPAEVKPWTNIILIYSVSSSTKNYITFCL